MHTFQPQQLFYENDYALVLLNRAIQLDGEFFVKIWNNASVRHVVDGGANHFFDFLDKLPADLRESCKLPEIASGDFDSISDASMKRLKENDQCKIALTADQDETDFTKGLAVLYDHVNTENFSPKLTKVVIICEVSGRLDQILSNLNTLHKNAFLQSTPSEEMIDLYMMSSGTLTWLLPANLPVSIKFHCEVPNLTCGIVPLMGPTKYCSTGLQWDLTREMECRFGGLISTSNKVISKNLEITSLDKHSIFTLEMDESKYIFPS